MIQDGSAFLALLRSICEVSSTSSWTIDGRHNRRVKTLTLVMGLFVLAMSGFWASRNAVQSDWIGFAIASAAFVTGVAVMLLARADRIFAAAILMLHGLLIWVSLAALFETPSIGIQPSNYLNLLPLIIGTYLVFHREGLYLRALLPIAGIVVFIAFSMNLVPPLTDVEPEVAVGRFTPWVNHITAFVATCAVVVIMQADVGARRALEGDIRRAIARGEFQLHYQPQVDRRGRIIGVEALLRWQHPTRGMIPPNVFIPLAEETGLIIPIGEWVLRTAAAQLEEWAGAPEARDLTIAVNVSATQFRQPDFVEQVRAIVSLSGACPQALKLELTESVLAEDMDVVQAKMQALKAFGISWSLDDFGTGYSSLSSLKKLPFEQIKIDQSFVRDLLADRRNMAIVETIVRLSDSLGLSVIAEGVETEAQRAALENAGCCNFQGYLFGRPMPVGELLPQLSAAA